VDFCLPLLNLQLFVCLDSLHFLESDSLHFLKSLGAGLADGRLLRKREELPHAAAPPPAAPHGLPRAPRGLGGGLAGSGRGQIVPRGGWRQGGVRAGAERAAGWVAS
jgi:hypothetical protein